MKFAPGPVLACLLLACEGDKDAAVDTGTPVDGDVDTDTDSDTDTDTDADTDADTDTDSGQAPDTGDLSCVDIDVGDVVPIVLEGSTFGTGNDLQGSCAFYGLPGPEVAYRFVAPEDASYRFDTIGSDFDTVLYVLDECGGAELACADLYTLQGEALGLNLVAGQSVVVVVDGARALGNYGLHVFVRAPLDTCGDGIDDDLDGLVDCQDPDCFGDPTCVEDCTNGIDDDLDWSPDCQDWDCQGDPACVEDCSNGVDDDGDWQYDCYDWDCEGSPSCVEDCANGVDDDGDWNWDCYDPDCADVPACVEDCDNGLDDDGDFSYDCADPDCVSAPVCAEDCENGFDDNGNGAIDCFDGTCAADPTCAPACPDVVLSGALPIAEIGSTVGLRDDHTPSCGGDASSDRSFKFTAPADGTYAFETIGSTYDTVLAVFDGCGGAELACNDYVFGAESRVQVNLNAGDTVVVVVDGYYGQSGDYELHGFVPNATDTCDDGLDDDVDGLADCFDPDCALDPACPESCVNGIDDDGDWQYDCYDTACAGHPACVENCVNGADDDGDNQYDCGDPDCGGAPACAEDCTDGYDDNWNGTSDCFDASCSLDPACTEDCSNDLDDDGDLAVDCMDAFCAADPACAEDCDNGLDDDGDFAVDCSDGICATDPACAPTCPDAVLSGALPIAESGSTVGLRDDHDPSCADSAASDRSFAFTAPADGTYTFDTAGSAYDTVLAVFDGCGGAELACDDDTVGGQSRVEVDLDDGDTVIVVVDGYAANAGDFTLTVQ